MKYFGRSGRVLLNAMETADTGLQAFRHSRKLISPDKFLAEQRCGARDYRIFRNNSDCEIKLMDLGTAGLNEQPFRTHGKPLSAVSYASQQEALKVLEQTRTSPYGLSLLQGPTLSGKSTLIGQFIDTLPEDYSVAVIDGNGLDRTALLETVLSRFGYMLDAGSTSELLAMLRVFSLQQAASNKPPVLIIENAHALDPSARLTLAELAELRLRGLSALKMVLVSDRPLLPMINDPEMERVSKRLLHDFHLHPMTNAEATEYLYTKLRAAGSETPEFVFPITVCAELWRASGGWPGILDRIALLALAKAQVLPVSIENIEHPVVPTGTWHEASLAEIEEKVGTRRAAPKIYVSLDGETIHTLTLDKPRLLIGRSEHNDIPLASKFISRYHALLVRHGKVTFLMDLNSTNGTYVNSKRISNQVLVNDDVVTLGKHRIKFIDPHAKRRDPLAGIDFSDTTVMKTLEDVRKQLAQENTAILPSIGEDLSKTRA